MTTSSNPVGRPATIHGPDPHPHPPQIQFPEGACDCHAHLFGPQRTFPYAPDAHFVPPDALLEDYLRMLHTIGCQRAVLVQPSIYGTDNSCMLTAMLSGEFDFRGVAVIDGSTSDTELEALHRAGIRGVRVNMASGMSARTLEEAPRLEKLIRQFGWHLQFFLSVRRAPLFEQIITQLRVACVIDHFGCIHASNGVHSSEFATLLRLARHSHVWFKLIGPYRISKRGPFHPDVTPFVRELVTAAPERCVWGTDWPHAITAYMPNDGDLANLLGEWIPDPAVRHLVLVDNPRRLYDFD